MYKNAVSISPCGTLFFLGIIAPPCSNVMRSNQQQFNVWSRMHKCTAHPAKTRQGIRWNKTKDLEVIHASGISKQYESVSRSKSNKNYLSFDDTLSEHSIPRNPALCPHLTTESLCCAACLPFNGIVFDRQFVHPTSHMVRIEYCPLGLTCLVEDLCNVP